MEMFLDSTLYLVYAGLLGLIIGSFLNVFIYRFHTGRSINGSSHCLSCQLSLSWYELLPLVSYTVLRGRCRQCGSYIPSRYFLVELLTGAAFVLSAYFYDGLIWSIWGALFLAVLICVLVYDLYHTIIPDEFSVVLTTLAFVAAAYAGYVAKDYASVVYALVAGAAAAGPFIFLWVISQGRWIGLGDAKLAFPLGVIVGLQAVFSFVVLAFWVGAVLSLIYIGLAKFLSRGQMGLRIVGRPLTMKSEIPFAPFLILSFLLTVFWGVNVLTLLTYVI